MHAELVDIGEEDVPGLPEPVNWMRNADACRSAKAEDAIAFRFGSAYARGVGGRAARDKNTRKLQSVARKIHGAPASNALNYTTTESANTKGCKLKDAVALWSVRDKVA